MISGFIYDWLKNIVVLFIIITLVDLIMPKGSMKRYINLFIGLIVIFMVISPFLKLTSIDFKQYGSNIEGFNLQEDKSIDFTKQQAESIENIYIEKLSSKIKLIIEDKTEYEIYSVNVEIERDQENFGEIRAIDVILKEDLNRSKADNTKTINITKVKKVTLEEKKSSEDNNESFNHLKSILSEELEVDKDLIFIYIKT